MAGWASGFASGSRAARDIIQTYRDASDLREKAEAGEANRAGMQQQTATDTDYGKMDGNAVYSGQGADGTMTNAEAASYGLNVPIEDKDVGTGTTRRYGLGMSPSTWQDNPFTTEQRRVGGLRAQADFYAGRGEVEKAEAITNRVNVSEDRARGLVRDEEDRVVRAKESGLRLKSLGRADKAGDIAEAEDKSLRESEDFSSKWMQGRSKNKDGTDRILTSEDHLGALQQQADYLYKKGHTRSANIIMEKFDARTQTQIILQTTQRNEALGKASVAFHQTGDPNALKAFYNQFVPDGAQVTNISKDGKGNISIERTSLDGVKMKPVVMQPGEFAAGLDMFKDPSALYKWSQNEFKNNLELRKVVATEKTANAAATNANTNMQKGTGWGLAGQLTDGTPLYRNADGRMGLFKQGPDGKPVELSPDDTVRAIKGINAGAKAPVDVKYVRIGDATFGTDAQGNMLFRVTEDGTRRPVGADPWSGKDGPAARSRWSGKGVVQEVIQNPDGSGKLIYAYSSVATPNAAFTTPEEAFASGEKAKKTPASTMPAPGAGFTLPSDRRGFSSPHFPGGSLDVGYGTSGDIKLATQRQALDTRTHYPNSGR